MLVIFYLQVNVLQVSKHGGQNYRKRQLIPNLSSQQIWPIKISIMIFWHVY